MHLKRLVGVSAVFAATVLSSAPLAGAVSMADLIASGSAAPQPTPPARPVVNLGDYCEPSSEPAATADGRTAYCVRVQFTDAYIWSDTTDLLATDPHFPVSPGNRCLDPDAVTTGTEQHTLYCNPTQNGRSRGNLVWQLLP